MIYKTDKTNIFHFRFSTANNRNSSTGEHSYSSAEETSNSPDLDVTDLTAHCLRLENANEADSALHPDDNVSVPVRLILVGDPNDQIDSTSTQTMTRVWLVGQRPGRVRVKLAPVADSPLVKVALPKSLAKLRKHQHQQNQRKQNSDGGHWDAQKILWVTVTDNDVVWPVGITAQLVTGIF